MDSIKFSTLFHFIIWNLKLNYQNCAINTLENTYTQVEIQLNTC